MKLHFRNVHSVKHVLSGLSASQPALNTSQFQFNELHWDAI